MTEVQNVDVLIVGSGPSGTSTALHLVKSSPDWAKRIVVIDKAVHPREKLCGGGITHMGRNVLSRLGLTLEPRHFDVREARLLYQNKSYSLHGNPVFTVVRRDEFDHWLVQMCEKRGVPVRVRDVATVQFGPEIRRGAADYNGIGEAVGGMTMRQYAAIHLRVPNSGADWLDDMINQSSNDQRI